MSRNAVLIRKDSDRSLIAIWARNAPFGTTVEFRSPRRTTEQNAMLWSLLGQIAKQVEWYGRKYCAEDWKEICTASLRKAEVVPGIDPGTLVPLGMRTSDMTRDEMSALIELIIAFGTQHGVKFREFEDAA
ncbi:MAG: recombination protein NinB [Alphaproteobacteria bacterium]|nr:recombination protein NinB [Alphaproteobacteria bacterium]